MQGSLEAPPIIIRGRRWYPQMTWLALLFSLGAVSQAWMFLTPGVRAPQSAYISTPFLVIMLIGLFARAVWPPRMEIGPGGIVLRGLVRTRRRPWGEAFAFRPVRYRGVEFVGYDIPAGAAAGSALGRAVARNAGADGLLAGNMEVEADDLASLLNRARAQWTAEATAPAPALALSPAVKAWSAYITLVTGRFSRRAYWIGTIGAAVVVTVVALTTKLGPGAAALAFIPWSFVVRCRMRDLGHAPAWLGVWLLLPAIAFVMMAFIGAPLGISLIWELLVPGLVVAGEIILLGALPGQPGRNRYGPSPLGEEAALDAIFS
jgi:uncharacterized membrane protein YhaH (DUF805 family)